MYIQLPLKYQAGLTGLVVISFNIPVLRFICLLSIIFPCYIFTSVFSSERKISSYGSSDSLSQSRTWICQSNGFCPFNSSFNPPEKGLCTLGLSLSFIYGSHRSCTDLTGLPVKP